MNTPRKSYERVIEAFEREGCAVKPSKEGFQWLCQAPGHSAKDRSILLTYNGSQCLIYSYAAEQTIDIISRLGLTWADLYDSPRGSVYNYPGGRKVRRTPDKSFPQSGNKADRTLFGQDKLTSDRSVPVYIVEGEKDVETAAAAGILAVSSPMGAGNAHHADWDVLTGRDVIIVEDDDEKGATHTADVVALLKGKARSVFVAKAAEGKDLSDHIGAGLGVGELIPAAVGSVDLVGSVGLDERLNGAAVLDEVHDWFERFISVTNPGDLDILTLWAAHTHVVDNLYSSPRLQLDSAMPGSGKTTVLEHMKHLTHKPVHAAALTSSALMVRLLEDGPRTLLIDEADRSLDPHRPGVEELLAVVNSGYKKSGGTRPVLVPADGGWVAVEMSTFAPVAIAGNAPQLPDDTRSRIIRVLLMPDLDGAIEDSDWEEIDEDADALGARLARWCGQIVEDLRGSKPSLPPGCVGRQKEKWRPMKRLADAAGGDWPERVDRLIVAALDDEKRLREEGLTRRPPSMVLLSDILSVWEGNAAHTPTDELLPLLMAHNPEFWGVDSNYGKALTAQRMGRMMHSSFNIHSDRVGDSKRGYKLADLMPVAKQLKINPPEVTDGTDGTGRSDDERSVCDCGKPADAGSSMCMDCQLEDALTGVHA